MGGEASPRLAISSGNTLFLRISVHLHSGKMQVGAQRRLERTLGHQQSQIRSQGICPQYGKLKC